MSDTEQRRDPTPFGPNVWLVDEMYRRFLDSPESVSEAWREYFAEYEADASGDGMSATARSVAAPEQPAPAEAPQAPAEAPRPAPGAAPEAEEKAADEEEAELVTLVGVPATLASRMDESLAVPTATSIRTIPAKLLEVNRMIINNQLARLTTGGKVSFTHLIGWAVVRAVRELPEMNVAFRAGERPTLVRYRHVNLGLAVDVERRDGSRTLMVPNIKHIDEMDFRTYWLAYEELIHRVRAGKISPSDFRDTTVTLTNPGMIGTVQSVPRLMPDQGVIVGVGAIQYPPEYQGADPQTLARNGVGRVITVTSTYDHRVIQGAQSGEFLRRIHQLLLGEDGFYEDIFESMQIPYVPARWAVDDNPAPGSAAWATKQGRVLQLINMYRVRGHLIADLDPLRLRPPAIHPELDPVTHGLTIWDLDRNFATLDLAGQEIMPLGRILGVLRDAYCRTVGIEYMHIQEPDQKRWIQEQVEGAKAEFDLAEKVEILHKLNRAEAFERFLHTKYLGHKRFGLEGAESLIPMLDRILDDATAAGMEEVVVGMAHRGRLNVLANVIGKKFELIFKEFQGDIDPDTIQGSGDVKYHLGSKGVHTAQDGKRIRVEVASNPSHLEAVDPVLEGMVRAKQDAYGDDGVHKVLPLLIHGDAAFAGQGVVAETLNLSQLEGYSTGGTVHVVINNQVGFTTGTEEARSSTYATDVAKAVQSPILHVNGDDPEAVVRVARLAFAFRQAFHKDVVIDMVCYRRHGHNEADEPSFTQPVMYRAIDARRSVRKLYLERLVNTGDISLEQGEALLEEFRGLLESALATIDTIAPDEATVVPQPGPARAAGGTAVGRELLDDVERGMAITPDGFRLHPKLERVIDDRRALYRSGLVDWATAEALALGTLALQGHPVRIAGEDTRRGTFSQRHALLVDYQTGHEYIPLQHLSPDQAELQLVDSLLSEFAAMGFEYGYSIVAKDALVAWEAQFGDFANGAQVVIDQFVIAGEDKWGLHSGLALLLPHGFEGQGPEHSSARIERFLQLAAEENIQVVVPTTPSQYFHVLRRQVRLQPPKPLVVFTPKSLLRFRESFSPIDDLSQGRFHEVLVEPGDAGSTQRVVLCTGKLFYDLAAARRDQGEQVGLMRIEQLYPFPGEQLAEGLEHYAEDVELIWAQEEPENMGGWSFIEPRLRAMERSVRLIARAASASPATGSFAKHQAEQTELVKRALGS